MNRTAPQSTMRIDDVFAPDIVGTDAHLDRLATLRALGDVVELAVDASMRRTFIVVTHAAMLDAAKASHAGLLSSHFGTGVADVPEADRARGVSYRAINASDGETHVLLRSLLQAPTSLPPSFGGGGAGFAPNFDSRHIPLRRRGAGGWVPNANAEGCMLDPSEIFGPYVTARVGPRFGFDDDAVARGFALAHRAAFAWHDEIDPRRALVDVDRALVDLCRTQLDAERVASADTIASTLRVAIDAGAVTFDDAAWLARFAFLTAFVTTELAAMHLVVQVARASNDARDALRTSDEERARFVDASVRIQSPVARFGRVAVDDVTLAGVTIPKGARVILSFAAANHDPNVEHRGFAHAFGVGPHACIGAGVALEMLRAILVDVLAWPHFDVVDIEVLRSPVNRAIRRARLVFERSPP